MEDSVDVVIVVALLLLESSRGRVNGLVIDRREEALRRG